MTGLQISQLLFQAMTRPYNTFFSLRKTHQSSKKTKTAATYFTSKQLFSHHFQCFFISYYKKSYLSKSFYSILRKLFPIFLCRGNKLQTKGISPLFFSCKRAVYIGYVLFLSARTECRDSSRTPSVIHSFSCRRKRTNQDKQRAEIFDFVRIA